MGMLCRNGVRRAGATTCTVSRVGAIRDLEPIGCFPKAIAAAYTRWLDDPSPRRRGVMSDDSDELIQRFRTVALERLARIEAAWTQVLRSLDDVASRQLQREVHTLKGESLVMGFGDVNMVCHKLEDLLGVARARGYAVDDDFDLAVNMAIRFMVMLVRKRLGSELTAIDLPGFVRQIEGILQRHERPRTRSGSMPPLLRPAATMRVPPAIRTHLGPPAVNAFLEYAVATGARRDRLRESWHALRDLIGVRRAVISAEQLDKYVASTAALAHELGKQIELHVEIAAAEVTMEVLAALDVAALHLLRNAIDHGIEPPEERAAAGKPAVGSIRLRGRRENGAYVLSAEDDGRGIDFEGVQARAAELGLVTDGTELPRERIVELMCYPGLSTRGEPSEVSGRGVGLDAVRGNAVELGGTVTAQSEPGRGTTFTVSIPTPSISVEGHMIRAPGLRFPVVIAPSWRVLDRGYPPILVDLGVALGMLQSNSISSTVWAFSNGTLEVGLLCGDKPAMVQARRLVTTPPTSVAEVVTVDSIEGLLVRPDRIPGIA
jgi:two-component system, chemotaxis family, sensor kinase CheA